MFYNGKRNNPKFIINFPTKRHWKENSQLQDIKIGLNDLLHNLNYYNIKSIAMPALGCGLGNLDWKTVRSIIEETFKNIPNDVKVYVYRPKQ
jgi:O-acetyl-ADP-ribose deacetylase (regulator of RNase III)